MRRKRAIILFACQSFAWFTSKDEVTNRLTANSDYGVSIVESFAPPANWLPGQEINKDVYAVNTGNIAAFVKEELSGVLDYSYETKTVLFDPATCVELVPMAKEDIDGATTNEAGAFLAWTDVDGVETGFVNSARNEDVDNGDVSGAWHPTKTGHYIFRRTVKKNADGSDQFTYAGYYFVEGAAEDDSATDVDERKGKYYKIVLGKDNYRAANDGADSVVKDEDGSVRYEFDIVADQAALVEADGATEITPNADGSFDKAPLINYVKVVDLDPQDVSFKYNDGTAEKYNGAPYLAVRFSNVAGDLNAKKEELDKAQKALDEAKAALAKAQENAAKDTHDLAVLENTYRNAEYAYYTALSRYNKTLADMTYANKLIEETNKLYPKAADRANAEEKMKELKTALENAAKAVRDEANNEQGDTTATSPITDNYNTVKNNMLDKSNNTATGIASTVLVPDNIRKLIADNVNEASPVGGVDLTDAKRNLEVLDSIWKQIAGDPDDDADNGILGKISEDYDKFENTVAVGNKETDTDPDVLTEQNERTGYLKALVDDFDRLEALLKAYAEAYTQFAETAGIQEAALTHLTHEDEAAIVNRIGGYSKGTSNTADKIDALEAKAIDETDGLKKAIEGYRTAYNDYYNYMAADAPNGYYAKVKAWNDAVNTYNTNVNGENNPNSAKAKYDAAIAIVQKTKNNAIKNTTITYASGDWTLVNDGEYLVNGFSAHSVGNVTAENVTADNNLVRRDKGASGTAVSKVSEGSSDNSKSTADPRITSATDTNYLNYVVNNTSTDEGALPYVKMDDVAQRDDSFLQKSADPNPTRLTLSELSSRLGDANNGATKAYNDAKDEYDTKATALKETTKELDTLKANVKTAEDRVKAVENAKESDKLNSNINIDVVLDKNVVKSSAQPAANATWVFDEDTDNTQTPTFYYNRVLDAGKTSEKLVDKLVFCDNVKASDFKDLQFDLNVALDSMQVTYDPQNNTEMTATAVNASDDFDMTAAIDQTNKEDVKVTWSDKEAVATVYKVGDDKVTLVDLKPEGGTDTSVTVGATNYRYKVTVGGKNYYGVAMPEKGAKANFYQIDTTDSNNPKLVTGEGSIVEVTAE